MLNEDEITEAQDTASGPPDGPASGAAIRTQPQTRRITVNLRATDIERIEEIAADTGMTANEILRRALATQSFVNRTQREGRKILVTDEKGKDIREVEILY